METMRPRMAAGLTSAMYTGESIEAAPTPMPAMIRQTIKAECVDDHPMKMEEIIKMPAAIMSGSLRPKRSAKGPVNKVPMMQPTYNELPVQPNCASLK